MTKILVIDDEPEVRETIAMILESHGYQVVDAKDGDGGLEALGLESPDLIITDILMPGRDGLETIMEMRRRSPNAKIIAISGGGSRGIFDYLDAAQSFGACHTIVKPFGAVALLEQVQHCLAASPQTH